MNWIKENQFVLWGIMWHWEWCCSWLLCLWEHCEGVISMLMIRIISQIISIHMFFSMNKMLESLASRISCVMWGSVFVILQILNVEKAARVFLFSWKSNRCDNFLYSLFRSQSQKCRRKALLELRKTRIDV